MRDRDESLFPLDFHDDVSRVPVDRHTPRPPVAAVVTDLRVHLHRSRFLKVHSDRHPFLGGGGGGSRVCLRKGRGSLAQTSVRPAGRSGPRVTGPTAPHRPTRRNGRRTGVGPTRDPTSPPCLLPGSPVGPSPKRSEWSHTRVLDARTTWVCPVLSTVRVRDTGGVRRDEWGPRRRTRPDRDPTSETPDGTDRHRRHEGHGCGSRSR